MSSRSKRPLMPPFFTLHFVYFQMRRQRQSEPLQQYRLVFCRLRNAPSPDVDATFGRQYDIHHLYPRDLIEDLTRLIAQTRSLAELSQCFPDHIGKASTQECAPEPVLSSDAISGGSIDRSSLCETPLRPE